MAVRNLNRDGSGNPQAGASSFTSNGNVSSLVGIPKRVADGMTTMTTPTRAGTVQVFRVDHDGTLTAQGAAVATSANATDRQFFATVFPYQVKYTNTDANAGTVDFKCAEGERT